MRGVIWYHTKENGEEQIAELIDEYAELGYYGHLMAIGNQNEQGIYFTNGDYWQIFPDTTTKYTPKNIEDTLGWNIAYIDEDIDEDFIESIILPLLNQLPFCAYNYY